MEVKNNHQGIDPTHKRDININRGQILNTHSLQNTGSRFYLPVISCSMAGQNNEFSLLDSGASLSVMEESLYNIIKNDPLIKKSTETLLINSITGHKLDILGSCQISIKIADKSYWHKFYITKQSFNAKYRIILGFDFLQAHEMVLNFKDNLLKANKLSIKIRDASEISSGINNLNYARLLQKCILLPGESRQVDIVLEAVLTEDELVKLSPLLDNYNVSLQNDMARVSKRKTSRITLKNDSTERITLNKSFKIASLETTDTKRDMEAIKQQRRREFNINNFDLSHLSNTQKHKLSSLLQSYAHIFSQNLDTIGLTQEIEPQFVVDDSKLQYKRQYPVPMPLRGELKEQIEQLLAGDIIQESESSFTHPVLLVRKNQENNGKESFRIVQDYRALNLCLTYQKYPMPLANHLLDCLRGGKYYTTLDLQSSFWQVSLNPKDRKYTAFSTPFGVFEFKRLSQGLKLSPAIMQRLSDRIVAPLSELKIANYIDDFGISATDFDQMLYKLEKLFERLSEFGLTLNPKKCIFAVPQIKFLGHVIDSECIRPTEQNIRKIQNFPTPTTVRKLRRFLGISNFYRRYISKYAEISAPLTELTKKGKRFKWTEVENQSFEILKDKLSREPITLKSPLPNVNFTLTTDASDICIAACLGQRIDGVFHPISYYSRKLNPTEKKYTIMEKELLAIVCALKSYSMYVYGTHFDIECDNAPLQRIKDLSNPSTRIGRWLMYLAEFDFTFTQVKGTENYISDALSRDFVINSVVGEVPTMEEIKAKQREDPKLRKLMDKLNSQSELLSPSEETYFIRDGMLMHLGEIKRAIGDTNTEQIVVPDSLRAIVLKLGHDIIHMGHVKTLNRIKERWFWVGMWKDVKDFVSSCLECAQFKSINKMPKIPLQTNVIATHHNDIVSIDHIGPLPLTNENNKYILVFVDQHSRYLRAFPTKDQTAETSANKLYEYISQMGCMNTLLSDRGPGFTSKLFALTAEKLKIKTLRTSAFHPRTDGINEASHKTLRKSLAILARDSRQWDRELPLYELEYNNSIHSTTGEKPSFLVFFRDLQLPTLPSSQEIKWAASVDKYPAYIQKQTEIMSRVNKNIAQNLEKATFKMEKYENIGAKHRNFFIGQLVMMWYPNLDKQERVVKRRSFKGPYRIVEMPTLVNSVVIDINNPKAKSQRVHNERLMPFTSRRADLEITDDIIEDVNLTVPKTRPLPEFGDEADNIVEPMNYWSYWAQNSNSRGNAGLENTERNRLPAFDSGGQNGETARGQTNGVQSPARSEDTIIYDVQAETGANEQHRAKQRDRPQPAAKHGYSLRSAAHRQMQSQSLTGQQADSGGQRGQGRQTRNANEGIPQEEPNLPDRILNWAERITRPEPQNAEETSTVLNFLNKIADKLQ